MRCNVQARFEVLQAFLRDEFFIWTPEHAPYDTFVAGLWQPACRDDMTARVGKIVETAAAKQDVMNDADLSGSGMMIDFDALRRWFTEELWGAAEPTWFTNTGPGTSYEPAAVGVDDDLLAIIWQPR